MINSGENFGWEFIQPLGLFKHEINKLSIKSLQSKKRRPKAKKELSYYLTVMYSGENWEKVRNKL